MKNIFNLNNPVWTFIGRLVDVFILNILWAVCSVPVVTFGPATIALYYSMMKTVRDENPKYIRNFFKTMKENMSNGIPLGLVMIVIGGLIVYSIYFYNANADYADNLWILILKYLTYGVAVIYIIVFQWVFALSSRFVNTTGATIRNAAFIGLKNFWWTVLMVLVLVFPLMILYITNFFPILFISFGLSVYINAYILNHVLQPMIRKAKEEQGIVDEETEEGRYSEEELAAASEWHAPKSLSSSGYAYLASANRKDEAEEAEDTAGSEETDSEDEAVGSEETDSEDEASGSEKTAEEAEDSTEETREASAETEEASAETEDKTEE